MALIDDIKNVLGVSGNDSNTEINDLIATAKADLELSGIIHSLAIDDTDALIKRAITVYCQANFYYDNKNSERLQKSYDLLKQHLTMAVDYNTEP